MPITPEAVAALRDAVARPLAELRAAEPSAAAAEALRDVHDLYGYHTGARLRALRFARAARLSGAPPARSRPAGRGARVAVAPVTALASPSRPPAQRPPLRAATA